MASSGLLLPGAAQAQEPARPTAKGPPRDRGESRALAKFVAEARYEDLPPAAVAATKRSILDAVGVSLGAAGLEPACRPFVDLALEMGAAMPQSVVFGQSGKKVQAAFAALANGAMAHCLDYEDIHDPTGMHPNGATVPAALAVADAMGGVSGKELIVAVAVGSDIAIRLAAAGKAYGITGTDNGFYPPPIVCAFGATAAAAKLLKLDEGQVLAAFGLALCQTSCSSELLDSPDSDVRAVRDGFAAQTGVMSASLAKRGVTGFDKPFEGARGFYVMYGDGRYDHELLVGGLGRKFNGEDIRFKAWPACAGNHIYVQAALELMEAHRLDVDQIVRITSPVPNTMLCEPAATKRAPRTAIDAKFSTPFCIATALIQRDVTLASFSDRALKDPKVLKLAATFGYRIDPKAARLTEQGGGDILEVETRDGRVYRQKVEAIYGSRKKPLSDEVLLAKFDDCAAHAPKPLAPTKRRVLAERLMSLETVGDTRAITREV